MQPSSVADSIPLAQGLAAASVSVRKRLPGLRLETASSV